MSGMSPGPKAKQRRTWPVTVALAVVGVLLGLCLVHRWLGLPGYGFAFPSGGDENELLCQAVLNPIDWAEHSPNAARGREDSEPSEIDGFPGKMYHGWYANGNPMYQESYLGKDQHGPETWWDEWGQKIEERHWRHGSLHGLSTRWYANGQKAEESPYDAGGLHGTHRTWYRNGQEATRMGLRNGIRQGDFVAWHPSGQKWCEAVFSDDRLHGVWRAWDEAGKLVRQAEYGGGNLISEEPGGGREPFSQPGILGSPDFALLVAQGSSLGGFNTVRVSAAGRCNCRYYFIAKQPGLDGKQHLTHCWRGAEFRLSGEEQRLLREALEAANFLALRDEYIDPSIADGTQWILLLRAGGREKRIYCGNYFPEPLKRLSRRLRDQIMAPHKMELLTASPIRGEQADFDPKGWLEDGG